MRTRARNPFTTVATAGLLLPVDLLTRVIEGDPALKGLSPKDYHLRSGERLNEAASRAWNECLAAWKSFRKKFAALPASDAGTTLTRDEWLLPLFQELGYGRLQNKKAIEIDGKEYPVSHGWEAHVPIHLLSARLPLDRRTPGTSGAATRAPYSLLQELINRSGQHRWGFVTNGLKLFLLRDNAALARAANVEFDLEAMMDGELYADFMLLFLLCHQSRVEISEDGKPENCWLEKWANQADQQGTRAREKLRDGVETAIKSLGAGFLTTKGNSVLRERLRSGELATQDYYRQLLRLVYRLLMLLVAEEKKSETGENLLHKPGTSAEVRERYARFYSVSRIRTLAYARRGTAHTDLYESLKVLFHKLRSGYEPLGIPGMGSFLFSDNSTPDLDDSALANQDLLDAFRNLCYTEDVSGRGGGIRRPVDFGNLGSEELGSVYESLLELHPLIDTDAGPFTLGTAAGHERKTTGSYYTPTSLINCLLDSALDPVVEDRLQEADRLAGSNWQSDEEKTRALRIVTGRADPIERVEVIDAADAALAAERRATYEIAATRQWDKILRPERYARLGEQALLGMKVCDPACGSGHFLIAAAERMALHLARLRTGDDQPNTLDVQHAKRDIIGRCIYGVDLNPMAVELCKVSLWMEALEPGKPLSFLDHHIQCGNSLLGTTPKLLADGIPDDAFKPIEGDDKTVCAELKKDNKRERKDYAAGYRDFHFTYDLGNLPAEFAKLTGSTDESVADAETKAHRYAELVKGTAYQNARLLADTWCAAFVWTKDKSALGKLCPTERGFRNLQSSPHGALPQVRSEIIRLRDQYQFFHWHLAYPDVFRLAVDGGGPENEQDGWNGGFNVVLGNPPWERIKIQENEWFAGSRPDIAEAGTATKRNKLIIDLQRADPPLYQRFKDDERHVDGTNHQIRDSGRYPLAGRGEINTYAIFAELNRRLLAPAGLLGCILQSGIATDNTTRFYFASIVNEGVLHSLYSFDNKERLFPAVKTSTRFCLVTIGGVRQRHHGAIPLVFYARNIADAFDEDRQFLLTAVDIARLNPNTQTCPVFRSRTDAAIVAAIYGRIPVVVNDQTQSNEWALFIRRVFDMNKSENLNAAITDQPHRDSEVRLMYEAKLVDQFNHRKQTYGDGRLHEIGSEQLHDPNFILRPRYWIPADMVDDKIPAEWSKQWLITWQDVTDVNTMARTVSSSILPRAATDFTLRVGFPTVDPLLGGLAFVSALNSFVFDYVSRQMIGGTHLSDYIFKQLPLPSPKVFRQGARWADGETVLSFLQPRVVELTYTARELEPFAVDCGYDGPPFRWDEERRFQIRCELDAAYFHLYLGASSEWGVVSGEEKQLATGHSPLTEAFPTPRDAVDYIMDTFPIVRRKDEAKYDGDYRTKRVILEIYDAMAEAIRTGQPYQTWLDPSAGPPESWRVAIEESAAGEIPAARYVAPAWPTPEAKPDNWPDHIHPPLFDDDARRQRRRDLGEAILMLRLLLAEWNAAVQRDALELGLVFAINDHLRRRIVADQPLPETERAATASRKWLPRMDRQLAALEKNGILTIDNRDESQFISLVNHTGLDTALSKSYLPVVRESLAAFEKINRKRESDAFDAETFHRELSAYVGDEDIAQLVTF